ncbi:Gfo/Idh/MocA family oxidoreductase [Kiritimatiellota bacterium B12222]|nr:Gfo/Idh/MocA family oxidoreductase [Kiritimatiellota bacterium B12222]
MKKLPLQIALTGITGYARNYLESIKLTSPEKTELRAVTAINRTEHEAFCADLETSGAEVFTTYTDMINAWKGRIDLCALPVPIHLHLPMTLQALEADMNVVLEKPMAGSVEQGQAICDAAEGEKRIAIGFQDMYRPSTHKIAKELNQGRIGKITGVTMLTLWPRAQSYYQRNNWAGAIEVNGHIVRDSPINNATAHFVNLSLFFAGLPSGKIAKAQKVTAELFRARDISSFDTAAIRILTDTGIPLHLYATHSCKENETATVTVHGEKGTMTWVQGQHVEWKVEGSLEKIDIETMSETKEFMWNSVLDSLMDGSEFCCTPEMAMSHVELVETLHRDHSIKDIETSFLTFEDSENDLKTYLPSMAADLKRCRDEKALPSELNMAWAI